MILGHRDANVALSLGVMLIVEHRDANVALSLGDDSRPQGC